MKRIPRSTYAGVFLLALSIILFQIALTRVFAVMMWHHLTYMVVSIALLGFGAAGSLLTAQRDALKKESPLGPLALASAGYGLAVIASYLAVREVDINSLELWKFKANLGRLLAIYAIVAVPYLLGGLALGMALMRFVDHVDKLYFTDLVGSAVGGAASVGLLVLMGGASTVLASAVLGAGAGLAFAIGGRKYRGPSVAALVITFGLWLTSAGLPGMPNWDWDPPFAPGKELLNLQTNSEDVELDRIHSATAEVEVGPSMPAAPFIGGDFGSSARQQIQARLVGQDGTAPTQLMQGAGRIEDFPFLRTTQAASSYVARESLDLHEPNVLVIGVGGGVDVMVALAFEAQHVTAVEINSAMIEMVTERYDEYLDGLMRPGAHSYSDRVELVQSEGRSHMRSRDEKYDIIQMSGVDSFTALSTGAYTLSESYLYTIEAVQEFYEHLKPGGYVNYSRFILTRPQKKPRETLRLANIAFEALTELGIEDPASHIAVFQGEVWASTMIKRGPFTRTEIDALERFADEENFIGLIYDPLHTSDQFEARPDRLARVRKSRRAFVQQLHSQLMPGRAADEIEAAAEQLTQAYLARFEGNPAAEESALDGLAAFMPEDQRERARVFGRTFLDNTEELAQLVTQGLIETRSDYHTLLRGTPDERRAFLDTYEYDISACTDDSPFFFNYYRYGMLLDSFGSSQESELIERYHPDFPVGHMVLIASLVQIAILALVLIFLPLRALDRRGLKAEGTWRFFTYFAALGMGFMFVEIVLMQKLVIFLGHPTYAVSVVLSSLLGFAGIGSFLSGKVQVLSKTNLMRLAFTIAATVLLVAFALDQVLPALLGQSFALRAVATVITILPLGLVLGMAFPTGLRIVKDRAPQLLPWCWAINGFLSVFSSLFCIVLSMVLGFSTVLSMAAVIYLIGFMAMPAAPAQAESRG